MNINEILTASKKMQGILYRTPTIPVPWLSEKINGKVYFKLENLQHTSSFKPRGALIKMLKLTDQQKAKGVVAMSAGNHAQGVAFHAQRMNIPAIIVMPETTPAAKIERTRKYGATVILSGQNLAESEIAARDLVKQGLTLIHPYDDEDIITGQGTVALEMLEDAPDIDTLIIPVGGGGLAAGCSLTAKALKPQIKIYGVQSTACPAMIQALYPERWFMPPETNSLPMAEGIAVKNPGRLTADILKTHLNDILAVNDTEIEDAIDALAMSGKIVAEGAGAAGVAALMKNVEHFYGKSIGIIICGGNIDSRVLSSLMMHSLVRQEKLIRLKIKIPDTSGTLAKVTGIIGRLGGNIFELIHQRHFTSYSSKMTVLEVTIETRGQEHSQQIMQELINAGYITSLYH
ncbi:threonine ammonia-lyase [Candidatus Odyssella thessalonicensis]|uniref:threonine ammonia-lyase n=1 Tax=Candidatus Odyssella thessalonicensis TaxID=84647 RepID=UPI000225B443|nr:threonine ammonia-lyase [Candidatus Odyssella thessalonicensis]